MPNRTSSNSQIWISAAILVGLAITLGIGGMYWSYGNQLQDHGQKVMADVTDVHGPANRERIAYTYTVDGKTYKADEGIHDAEFSIYTDKQVSVTYLPENPAVSHFDPPRYRQRGQMICALALGAMIVAITIFVNDAKKRKKGQTS